MVVRVVSGERERDSRRGGNNGIVYSDYGDNYVTL